MKHYTGEIDRSDPKVAQFVEECGLAAHATAIKLTSVERDDLDLQIKRLRRILGALIVFNRPHQTGHGWAVTGTIIG